MDPSKEPDGTPKLYRSGEKEGEQKTMKPSVWLDQNRAVQDMGWCPGFPQFIRDRVMCESGMVQQIGAILYNRYRPPPKSHGSGDASKAGFWLWLVSFLWPKEWQHMVAYFAWKVQRPGVKINHQVNDGGDPGIGKDAVVVPVAHAIGLWNFRETSPRAILEGQYNGYLECVILRVNEMHDVGEGSRYKIYESFKWIRLRPLSFTTSTKNHPHHPAINCNGTFTTTNYRLGSLHIPENDRRNFCMWSERTAKDFPDGYWDEYFDRLDAGGNADVAAFLHLCPLAGSSAADREAFLAACPSWHEGGHLPGEAAAASPTS